MRGKRIVTVPVPIVVVRGEFGEGVRELVAERVTAVARHAKRRILSVRVELTRHPDPAVELPVTATMTIDLNGATVNAHATARTAYDAVHGVVARVVRQLDER